MVIMAYDFLFPYLVLPGINGLLARTPVPIDTTISCGFVHSVRVE